ncbi:MAG: hypothetical protein QNK37_20265 [Acidobacteriota bacterium]|nr:hypothetical protein [Acidobacteriota bacterium]
MTKKIFAAISVIALLGSIWLSAGGTACRDNYTLCTEGGCGVLAYGMNCKLRCILPDGSKVDIACGQKPKPEL